MVFSSRIDRAMTFAEEQPQEAEASFMIGYLLVNSVGMGIGEGGIVDCQG